MKTRLSRRATINDVARVASVSRQTVSNALNKPHLLAAETLVRVQSAIEELGYRPNQAAQSMRAQRAGAIGVELNAVSTHPSDIAQPFLTHLTLAAPRHDAHVVPFAHQDCFPAVGGYEEMVRRRLVDAFIIADTHLQDPRPDWLLAAGIPFAAFGRIYSHPELTCWADVDGRAGTMAAVEHLAAQGYATVGYLGWPVVDESSVVATDRRAGWLDATEGDRRGPERVCDQDLRAAKAAAADLLTELGPGDAVVCASDLLALGVAFAAVEAGLQVGRDLGLVGFDGSPVALHHGLTSVAQPLEDLADLLLSLVHGQLSGGDQPSSGQLLTPWLAPGPSTDPDSGADTASTPLPTPGTVGHRRREQEGTTP